jgi:integrase/recombinase XerD
MPRKSEHRRRGIYLSKFAPVDAINPESVWAYLQRFTRWQQERQYSEHTIYNRERTLKAFAAWAQERGLVRPHEVTKPILERWQRHLYLHRKPDGQPLSARTQIAHTEPLKAFFKWLARENYILYNPASELDLPRIGRRLPKHILTVTEVEKVLGMPKVSTGIGIRDRAILETFYSTGLRRQELINLKLHDIDAERGVVMVREGKGKKDRMIPIGTRALSWIDKYQDDVRPDFASGADDGTLFITQTGMPINPGRLAEIARGYIDEANIGKRGACHIFRHTMATLMLENGADIRYIQVMLGHADLSTTEIYTQVAIKTLKAVHTATHPGKPISSADRYDPTKVAALLSADALAQAHELLDALDLEADEEEND